MVDINRPITGQRNTPASRPVESSTEKRVEHNTIKRPLQPARSHSRAAIRRKNGNRRTFAYRKSPTPVDRQKAPVVRHDFKPAGERPEDVAQRMVVTLACGANDDRRTPFALTAIRYSLLQIVRVLIRNPHNIRKPAANAIAIADDGCRLPPETETIGIGRTVATDNTPGFGKQPVGGAAPAGERPIRQDDRPTLHHCDSLLFDARIERVPIDAPFENFSDRPRERHLGKRLTIELAVDNQLVPLRRLDMHGELKPIIPDADHR